MKVAYLAAGCFWGVQYKLDALTGVTSTEVGYMGGDTLNPTYKDVCKMETGHAEVVKVTYDESILSFKALLHFFFEIHNPTTLNRQGPDVGTQYRSAIFTQDPEEIKLARSVIQEVEAKLDNALNKKVVTSIEDKLNYYSAEEYHQKYLVKNPGQCSI